MNSPSYSLKKWPLGAGKGVPHQVMTFDAKKSVVTSFQKLCT